MEAKARNRAPKSKEGAEKKPPTRLQKHAPTSLDTNTVSCVNAFSPAPIPLLSPLILSPPPSPGREENFTTDTSGGKVANARKEPTQGSGGWRHPASPMVVEAASLPPFFQSQCSLSHNVL
ncbi:hypothetical protein QJS04_geneDACA007749 [Acorus gramineus]|uniref:Uncharacterized protein n=1 Tax=Acorus gramineus TaxID=55184 RepID=A0AAV9B189_ACOGR|nr:hypothetical protein QJS04_geneDACA007749 [Acorus gramineus]